VEVEVAVEWVEEQKLALAKMNQRKKKQAVAKRRKMLIDLQSASKLCF